MRRNLQFGCYRAFCGHALIRFRDALRGAHWGGDPLFVRVHSDVASRTKSASHDPTKACMIAVKSERAMAKDEGQGQGRREQLKQRQELAECGQVSHLAYGGHVVSVFLVAAPDIATSHAFYNRKPWPSTGCASSCSSEWSHLNFAKFNMACPSWPWMANLELQSSVPEHRKCEHLR